VRAIRWALTRFCVAGIQGSVGEVAEPFVPRSRTHRG
jgi:hypothetical protein